MDSMDSETFYIITLFQQGSYRAAISAHLSASSPSPLQTLYAARSHLALTPPAIPAALSLLNNLQPSFNQRAILSLAHYLSGETERAINDLEEVLMDLGDGGLEGSEEGRMVRGVVGTVYFLEGGERRDEGIEVLREAVELGGDSECLAILTHLYLLLSLPTNSADLLQSPHVQSFTSDSTLSQLLTAQTNLATGPSSKYQEAFYVYEEIKSMQGGRCESVLNGLATCNAAMGKWSDAGKELQEGLEMNPSHPTSLANAAALALHLGKTPASAIALLDKLRTVDPNHAMLIDLDEKENLFDTAAARFGISA